MIHCLYINLDSRPDRRVEFESQFTSITNQIEIQRLPAIAHKHGAVGCSKSHIQCLQIAIDNNWPYLLICEDDFELIVPPNVFATTIQKELQKREKAVDETSGFDWDVLLLSGFVRNREMVCYDGLVRIHESQGANAYIVHRDYYKILLANYCEGVSYLERFGKAGEPTYALDQYWKQLQRGNGGGNGGNGGGKWYITVPLLGKQRPGYSDIVGKDVNYDDYYLQSDYNRSLIRDINVSDV